MATVVAPIVPPTFESVEEERAHRKQRLTAGLRVLAMLELVHGIAGHVSVQDPGQPERFWVNPLGVAFGLIRMSDPVLVDMSGKVVSGDRPINTAAYAIHAPIHAMRPDVIAVAHAHTIHGGAWSAKGRLLDPSPRKRACFTKITRSTIATRGRWSTRARAVASPRP